ncbi:hypothetical protein Snoj_75070 [Streptomyces nojiriensis]|uniref:Uncharacterized protein n=1 Tax=Streptomyces nojiriensis TaxID=66374 RepID=A0ABQ3SZM8_9ACTN|nr:hypothetical protein GCM10010205_07240 [Streptomyces nojiriensis]GHI73589.1 hypothetical protein Snoj_75070 [Streptomyces nojiriensis]
MVAGLLALGAGVPGSAQASAQASVQAPVRAPVPEWDGPEADVAYHGRVALSGTRLRIWLVPENDGPAALPNATVRVRLSAELADRQELAEGCARAGLREVVCETGPLPLHGRGRHIGLLLELRDREPEVAVRVDTWWNGGATDRNRTNNEHVVLALDTGDAYAF